MSSDPNNDEYSPAHQDEYRRLWHEAAFERDRLHDQLLRIATIPQGFMDSRQFHEFLQSVAGSAIKLAKEPATTTYNGQPIDPDRPFHTYDDTPSVGDDIYVDTALFLSHGADDFHGGLAQVISVAPGMTSGEYVPFVQVRERPHTYYNWRTLRVQQGRLREKFGAVRSYPDPDMRPEFNRWD